MFLLRVRLPDRPGSLGEVATAMGAVGADISAIEIVERGEGYAIDDVMLALPPEVLPDTLVSACNGVPGVRVLWVSRYQANWGIESDIATLNRMADDPDHAAEILTEEAPVVFHCHWAVLVRRSGPLEVVAATGLAPDLDAAGLAAFGQLDTVRAAELPAEWQAGWGETTIAMAPLRAGRTIVIGRQGGPEFLASELTRLRHLAALAT